MNSIRLSTLSFDSCCDCSTNAGPIILYTVLLGVSLLNSYNLIRGRVFIHLYNPLPLLDCSHCIVFVISASLLSNYQASVQLAGILQLPTSW